jgi:predicted TIM-barrel fold metal-dependent hydrolase
MIIDSHVHIGTIGQFHMPESMVLSSMEKYQIDFALVSNIEGSEVDGDQVPIPKEQQINQQTANQKTLQFARSHPDKIGALLWTKPATEGCNSQFEALVADNRDMIYGLKVHPYLSNISFGSPEVKGYIQLAQKYELVMVTHTSNDDASDPKVVYEVAKKFPDVNFVMVHMGLATDNQDAIQLIPRLPNLYGDSTWVTPDKTLQAIRECGIDKILFGTDNPIAGPDTYNYTGIYPYYFNDFKADLSTKMFEKFMFRNAIRLFKLDQFRN